MTDADLSKIFTSDIDSDVKTTKEYVLLRVGEFFLHRDDSRPGMIWIEHETGEGAEFKEDLLSAAIGEFYNEYF